MKVNDERNTIEVTFPWSLGRGPYRRSTVLEISGYVGFLRAVLRELITVRTIRHPELEIGDEPLSRMSIGHSISLCGQRLTALGWTLFHAEFAAHFSNIDPEVMRIAESVYFLCDDPNRSLTIQQVATHLGCKPAAVRKWAKQACKLGFISIETGNGRENSERLKVCMYLTALSGSRDRQLEEEAEDAALASTD